jgi:hypothetical protein
MANDPDWVPAGVDILQANTARVYDYLVGGTHNFRSDQDVGRAIMAVDPNAGVFAKANRDFLGRAVRFLSAAGIGQFLDIGSGIPTEGNVHEVAQRASPAARVVYVDVDPVAIAHSQAILADTANAEVISGDLRDPAGILADETTRRLIDLSQPVGLLLVAVLHFIADDDDPWRLVAALRDAIAPGSYLVLAQGTFEGQADTAKAFEKMYNRSVATKIHMRSRADILRFFDGFELVDPGLVFVPEWRPDAPGDVPADPGRYGNLVGVARKP